MGRAARSLLVGGMTLATLAGPACAGTSLTGSGSANWFYACGGGQTMNLAIRHADRTITRFSLRPGEKTRGPVERGDVVAWRCGAPVDRNARYIYIATMNPL